MTAPDSLVQRLWNYCNVLRDDGLSSGDYVEQLTYLRSSSRWRTSRRSRRSIGWPSRPNASTGRACLRDGDGLKVHYRHLLDEIGRRPGMLGVVFRKQNQIQDPAKPRRLIPDLIGRERWMTLDVDVKGDAYEGLLH